jgi:hypothetical protein
MRLCYRCSYLNGTRAYVMAGGMIMSFCDHPDGDDGELILWKWEGEAPEDCPLNIEEEEGLYE